MSDHRLAEVFGYPVDNFSPDAIRHRTDHLCPFNSSDPDGKCTKFYVRDKQSGELKERNLSNGVCSIRDGTTTSIICPVRFREAWSILHDAAGFFFKSGTIWHPVPETKLRNALDESVGNIDMVLAVADESGHVTDFGAIEIQGVYISGNVGIPFKRYIENPSSEATSGRFHADYLSSVKRLLQQLIRKGIILSAWGKKQAVMVDKGFYDQMRQLKEVRPEDADMAWFIYDLEFDQRSQRYRMRLQRTVYTTHQDFLEQFSSVEAGEMSAFVETVEDKLAKLIREVQSPAVFQQLADAPTDEFDAVAYDLEDEAR